MRIARVYNKIRLDPVEYGDSYEKQTISSIKSVRFETYTNTQYEYANAYNSGL